jgi:hypothetical protein
MNEIIVSLKLMVIWYVISLKCKLLILKINGFYFFIRKNSSCPQIDKLICNWIYLFGIVKTTCFVQDLYITLAKSKVDVF